MVLIECRWCKWLCRYFQDRDWTLKKMEVLVDVPDHLDLSALRATGPQPGEALQPEEPAAAATNAQQQQQQGGAAGGSAVVPDEALVSSLVDMGFERNACCRAAVAVGNAGAEAAMEWLLGHLEDPGINDPLPGGLTEGVCINCSGWVKCGEGHGVSAKAPGGPGLQRPATGWVSEGYAGYWYVY